MGSGAITARVVLPSNISAVTETDKTTNVHGRRWRMKFDLSSLRRAENPGIHDVHTEIGGHRQPVHLGVRSELRTQ